MTRSIFGWSYPPGVSRIPGDEDEGPCEVCGHSIDDCQCPECPVCGVQGDLACADTHGVTFPPRIRNVQQLCDFLSADTPSLLNKRIYKGTECGASISLYFNPPDIEPEWDADGNRCDNVDASAWDALHNGSDPRWQWTATRLMQHGCCGFSLQTIVEGSDATVDSDIFRFPVLESEVDAWVQKMESEADALWHEANDCERCGKDPWECECDDENGGTNA